MAFYREFHAARPRLTDRALWEWLFVRQPFSKGQVAFFILEVDGRIRGGIGYIEVRIRVDDRIVGGLLPVNYFIDPAYRGLPALRLLRTVMQQSPIAISAYVSDDAMRLLTKSGFVDLSSELLGYHHAVAAHKKSAASILFGAVRGVWRLARLAAYAAAHRSVRYRVSRDFDARFFERCETWAGSQRLMKDPDWLEWRYVKSPWLSCRFIYQFDAHGPTGCAVAQIDEKRHELVILDLLWRSKSTLKLIALLDATIEMARAEGCLIVTSQAMGVSLRRAFRLCLFGSTKSSLNILIWCKDAGLRGLLVNPARWDFMVGDTDAY
jgi:hypothetical protein